MTDLTPTSDLETRNQKEAGGETATSTANASETNIHTHTQREDIYFYPVYLPKRGRGEAGRRKKDE